VHWLTPEDFGLIHYLKNLRASAAWSCSSGLQRGLGKSYQESGVALACPGYLLSCATILRVSEALGSLTREWRLRNPTEFHVSLLFSAQVVTLLPSSAALGRSWGCLRASAALSGMSQSKTLSSSGLLFKGE